MKVYEWNMQVSVCAEPKRWISLLKSNLSFGCVYSFYNLADEEAQPLKSQKKSDNIYPFGSGVNECDILCVLFMFKEGI